MAANEEPENNHQEETNPINAAITNINEVLDILKSITLKSAEKQKTKATEKLQQTLNYLNQATAEANTPETDLASVRADIRIIKEIVLRKETYANVVKGQSPASAELQTKITAAKDETRKHQIQQRMEKRRTQVTLTMESADTPLREEVNKASNEDITKQFQQTINQALTNDDCTIQGIQKLKSGDIRVHCSTPQEAEALRNIDWNTAYKGLKAKKPKYGIVIHGVSISDLDPMSYNDTGVIHDLEQQNQSTSIKIASIRPLRKKPPTKEPKHMSIVVFTHDPVAADKCIKQGFYIKHTYCKTAKYAPHLRVTQCFKCYGYGHLAEACRSNPICGKCGMSGHQTKECTNTETICVRCKVDHPAWHRDCPQRTEEGHRIATIRRSTSPYHQL